MAITGATDLGNGLLAITITHDPSVTATNAPAGSLLFDSSGYVWRKLDSGSTTNVVRMDLHNSLTTLQGGQSGQYYHLTSTQHGLATTADVYTESEGQSDTDLGTYQTKLTLPYTPAVTGTFMLHWGAEFTNSSNNKRVSMLVDLDNTTTYDEVEYQPPANGVWIAQSSFKINIALTQGVTYNFRLKWRCISPGQNTASVRYARLYLQRIT